MNGRVVILIFCFLVLQSCYVIVPVINFGHLTVPQGDTGFLNKYEARMELSPSGEIQNATETKQGKTVKDLVF